MTALASPRAPRPAPDGAGLRASAPVLEMRDVCRVHGDGATQVLALRALNLMSGGQQQRVAIARALVGPRRLVLADEPTGALDSVTSVEVMRVLRARCDAGAAGLLVTHEARHAGWADRVVFLRDGMAVDSTGPQSTPESLLSGGLPDPDPDPGRVTGPSPSPGTSPDANPDANPDPSGGNPGTGGAEH